MLDHLGLHSALRAHVGTFARRTGIKTELIAKPGVPKIDGPRGEVLFRVVQEALNNVFKHAKATAARIELALAGDSLCMEITDNGCAFSLEEKMGATPTGRLGLLVMQERVRNESGTFSIESTRGKGTRIRVQVPIESKPRRPAWADDAGCVIPMPFPAPAALAKSTGGTGPARRPQWSA